LFPEPPAGAAIFPPPAGGSEAFPGVLNSDKLLLYFFIHAVSPFAKIRFFTCLDGVNR
jgi:hypothetical protein